MFSMLINVLSMTCIKSTYKEQGRHNPISHDEYFQTCWEQKYQSRKSFLEEVEGKCSPVCSTILVSSLCPPPKLSSAVIFLKDTSKQASLLLINSQWQISLLPTNKTKCPNKVFKSLPLSWLPRASRLCPDYALSGLPEDVATSELQALNLHDTDCSNDFSTPNKPYILLFLCYYTPPFI